MCPSVKCTSMVMAIGGGGGERPSGALVRARARNVNEPSVQVCAASRSEQRNTASVSPLALIGTGHIISIVD